MRILFVCTANICRSPIAEHYLRKVIDRLGARAIEVRSTGTDAPIGAAADPMMARLAIEHGLDLGSHRSRPIDLAELQASDEIIVMERRHRASLVARFPEVERKISLLRREDGNKDLADPIGGSEKDYRRALEILLRCVEQIALSLRYPV